jgi:Tol biopolymer transport system component
VVFESAASDLVRGDTNSVTDIFLEDRATHQTYRVSVTNGGGQANGESHSARGVTPDGRYVVFESFATNLVRGDTNGTWDVFLRDRAAHHTDRVSIGSKGQQGNSYSSDPVVSANGRYVAFESSATNLASSDVNGGVVDIFVRDRRTHRTTLASVTPSGTSGNAASSEPKISPNGRYVLFDSLASNLVKGDTNKASDVFVRDLWAHHTYRVSVGNAGQQGNKGSYTAQITPDGRYVAFESFASNLVPGDTNGAKATTDVFVRDLRAHRTYRVSVGDHGQQGNGFSSDPTISENGRYVAFESAASNFVRGDTNRHTDVFVRNLVAHRTIRADVSAAGKQGNFAAEDADITADGRYVVFSSESVNLVRGDTNRKRDVFVRGPFF